MILFTCQNVKKYMKLFLKETAFDNFHLRNLEIVSFAVFEITGLKKEARDESGKTAELYPYWQEIRPYALEIIKGNDMPQSIKAVLSCNSDTMKETFPEASALFLNILFQNDMLQMTTGTAQTHFTTDRSLENQWDLYIEQFLLQLGLQIDKQ